MRIYAPILCEIEETSCKLDLSMFLDASNRLFAELMAEERNVLIEYSKGRRTCEVRRAKSSQVFSFRVRMRS